MTPTSLLSPARSIAVIISILLLFWTVVEQSHAAVLAIDYGAEWTKAALVKPGIPLQIVLTKDSKRKEQSVVAFKKDERFYGVDASNLAARFPESTYPSLKTILGRSADSDVVEEFLKQHPANRLSPSNRSSLAFAHRESVYSVEELVAMQLLNIRSQAEKMADGKIKELVLTVPAFWSEQERKAILDAAELAGMRVLTLIHDGLAVAINYATTRTFSHEPQYHIIYDMGAGSTTATIVSFTSRSVTEGKSNKTITEIATHGIGFDRDLGGNLFNARIVDILVEAFRTSKLGAGAKTDIKSNDRALARLFKEASNVKHSLSANTETTASIESLHEDLDFRTRVSRATFEDATSDLFDRVVGPIHSALSDANITIDQVDSVILHGGSVRVPFVQKALEDVLGARKTAKTVNADEAAVMGAIFRGAQLNNQFKVKDIRSKDYSTYPVVIVSNVALVDLQDSSTVLFPRKTKLGNTKTVTFQTAEDVSFEIRYPTDVHLPADISYAILSANITGVAEKIDKLKGSQECHHPTVKVNVKLTDAGLVDVLYSEVQCELHEKKNLADKFMGLFGGVKDKDDKIEEQVVFGAESHSSEASGQPSASPLVDTSEKVRYEKTALRISVADHSPAFLTSKQKIESKKLLKEMDSLDKIRVAREEALNSLEAYIYRSRDFLEDEIFLKVSSVDEQKSFKMGLEAVSVWLSSSDSATVEDFISKLSELTDIERPISRRKSEHIGRPGQIEMLFQIINSTKEFVKLRRELVVTSQPIEKVVDDDDLDDEINTSTTSVSVPLQFDEDTLSTLESAVTQVERWLMEKVGEQEKRELWEEPILLLSDIERKIEEVQAVFRKILLRKSKPLHKAPQTSTSRATTASTAPSGETSTSSLPTETEDSADETTSKAADGFVGEETVTTTITSTILETQTPPVKHEEL